MSHQSVWQSLRSVLFREIDLVSKNLGIFAVVVLAPLFFALFYGSVYVNKKEQEVSIVVVDGDRSELSRSLVRNLNSHQMIAVESVLSDLAEGERQLLKAEVQAVVYIPAEFHSLLATGKQSDIRVNLNASRFLVANDLSLAVNEVAATMGMAVRLQVFESQGYSRDQARDLVEPVRLDLRSPFNDSGSYGDFLLPGVFVIILQQTLLMGLSQSIAVDRKNSRIRELYAAAGRSLWSAIGGKSVFYLILFAAYALLFFVALFDAFTLPIAGNKLALAIVTSVFLIAVVSLSVFASSFLKSQLVALQICILSSYPFFLLSGFTWPISSMPWLLKVLAQAIPSTPYITAVGRITQMGASWTHIWPQLLHLLVLALVGLVLVKFRWQYLFRVVTDQQPE